MLTPAILALTILATSALSGVLGMGGGLILMGVMAALLPIGSAMVLHGLTQMTANGFRAWLLRGHVAWRVLTGYALGALVTAAVMWQWRYVPSPTTVYLLLGAMPLAVMALPAKLQLNATKPWQAVLCGALITAVQCLAGVAGPLLDVFFVGAPLDRRSIVATKAITQTLSHGLKIAYFGSLISNAQTPAWMHAMAILLALGGTWVGRQYLEKLGDAKFRLWSRRLILVICGFYVCRAAMAFAVN